MMIKRFDPKYRDGVFFALSRLSTIFEGINSDKWTMKCGKTKINPSKLMCALIRDLDKFETWGSDVEIYFKECDKKGVVVGFEIKEVK